MAYKARKKRVKKNVPEGEVHIHATFNNTVVTITDKEGNVISGYPDGNDHAISALRYAYEPLFNRRGYSA